MAEPCSHRWTPWGAVGTAVLDWRRDCLICNTFQLSSFRPTMTGGGSGSTGRSGNHQRV